MKGEGKIFEIRFEKKHLLTTIEVSGKRIVGSVSQTLGIKMMQAALENLADEKVKKERGWLAWTRPCVCGPRMYGNVNLTIFLCPCRLFIEILEYMYSKGKGATKTVEKKALYSYLSQKGYSQKEIEEHLKSLHGVGHIVSGQNNYRMTELGIAIWKNWRQRFGPKILNL